MLQCAVRREEMTFATTHSPLFLFQHSIDFSRSVNPAPSDAAHPRTCGGGGPFFAVFAVLMAPRLHTRRPEVVWWLMSLVPGPREHMC